MTSCGDVMSLLQCGLLRCGLISPQTLLLWTNTATPITIFLFSKTQLCYCSFGQIQCGLWYLAQLLMRHCCLKQTRKQQAIYRIEFKSLRLSLRTFHGDVLSLLQCRLLRCRLILLWTLVLQTNTVAPITIFLFSKTQLCCHYFEQIQCRLCYFAQLLMPHCCLKQT